jgi:hypothetical protein
MLSGNLVAILFSGFVCTAVSLAKPQNFDFAQMDTISMVEKVCLHTYVQRIAYLLTVTCCIVVRVMILVI